MRTRADLYEYQRRAVQFIKDHDNCALFVEPGLGKTVTAMTAVRDLQDDFEAGPALVNAPLRVARAVWLQEVGEWAHLTGTRVVHIGGTPEQRLAAIEQPADFHTIGRENTQWLVDQFVEGKKQFRLWPWQTLIIDEAQGYAHQSSKRWKALRRVRPLYKRLIELSGTPVPQGYRSLWSQMYLLDRGARLGTSESAFLDRWFAQEQGDGYVNYTIKPNAAEEIQVAIADIVLTLRADDYLSLPPVMYNFIRVQLEPGDLKTYKKLERSSIAEIAGVTLTAVNAGVLHGKLLQLANGAVYTGEERNWVEYHREKVKALEELTDSITGKFIVAYYFKHDLERIKGVLEASDRSWAVLRSDKEFSDWADGKYDIGVIHPASCGHGLNSIYQSGAEDMVHFGLSANLELYLQANARLTGGHRRAGRNIRIHHIVTEGTIDDDYVDLIQTKKLTQDELLKALARRRH